MYFVRLPLLNSATIRKANALQTDWAEVLPPEKCSYVLGNPPFVGTRFQSKQQRQDMKLVTGKIKSFGLLDYVTAWYVKASDYIKGTNIEVGFVSTNSVTQGEQVGILWTELFKRGMRIRFGHRTFEWISDARGRAHVHVVIIGFGEGDVNGKHIYDYDADPEHPQLLKVKNISPYLIEGSDLTIVNRSKSINGAPKMLCGNQLIDNGQYLFKPAEMAAFVRAEPKSKKWFRRWCGAKEFINGLQRWCLWLGDCPPNELKQMSA